MQRCKLYYQLVQAAYIADIKGEIAEAQRKRNEISRHVEKCAVCTEFVIDEAIEQINGAPLQDQLFKRPVFIGKDIKHE